jgi:quinolinate synthase
MERDLTADIRELAARRGAIILAHHYQREEVRRAADTCGDSYHLAKVAASSPARVIVLAGVRFMAESAAILCPEKVVLHPRPESGCPLADSITAADVVALKKAHPGLPVVAYVNTTAAVKAESDYCCTSSNAVALVRSLGVPRVIMVPDANLAAYTARVTGVDVVSWRGHCHVHQCLEAADVERLLAGHPGALFVAHPECRPGVTALAHEVTSTAGMFTFVAGRGETTFIIGTEEEVAVKLRTMHPEKTFIVPRREMVCPNMKMIRAGDLVESLESLSPRVEVPAETARLARRSLDRMVAVAG